MDNNKDISDEAVTDAVADEEKKKLTKQQLMEKFAEIAGKQVESDRILLS